MLLRNWRQGDSSALDQVAEIVDRELHRLAAAYLKRERPGHTLRPTALVNEAFLRLMGQRGRQDWESRSHFVAIAAQHMRRILVDHARRHGAAKRGSGAKTVEKDVRLGTAWLRAALSAPEPAV